MSAQTEHVIVTQVDEMSVADLIQLLSTYPQDLKVVYPNPEGGFHPIHGIIPKTLALNVNDEYWYGNHDYPDSIDPEELKTKKQELCLILSK